jgi:hypothetical protein
MNFLKKGPELKLSDLKLSGLKGIKVPPAITDIYWDLRDRHLLPLVALVVVAIIAVPFLLGGGSEEPASPSPGETAGTASISTTGSEAANLTVVKATPGLRDYHKRLAHHTEKDPFKQKYTAPVLAGTQLGGGKASSSTTTVTTTTSGGSSGGGETLPETSTPTGTHSPPASSNPPGGAPANGQLTFFTWAINARITKSGGKNADPKDKPEPVVKKKVLPQTALPGEKAPVVTYMGLSRKTTKKDETPKVLLLVSSDVKSVFGEMKCVSGDDSCQLIEVEPGFPVTFVYGENGVHYTINVQKVELVVTGHADS